ncbi:hypothetical protein SERLA73DRAFT_162449 [Serpula lacrymans var. lacrymans S7.3]|uniref:Uncharacterized protein n=2 Tax=Serpula lacrymans var. lacrymans TaxID=341189 RepID=F8Q7W8_SERL3|nr:uncharacterized protein SERLADRAFT_441556 [Serpula lacrymans var. lacrymans S7.9]EGN95656.1 hypothetical protein SERLA73DRAFT_162449 [Serpula lacrymans var. lacrymans S7.3]EGO21182.1 hypothetical protein SERLADRAFT_441556 [Serpula lacrymans var. lacrymans S7.9]
MSQSMLTGTQLNSNMTCLFKWSYQPSIPVLCDFTQSFAKPRQKLEAVEAEIERMQAMLVSLQQFRVQLKEHIGDLETPIPPIQRVPREILLEIFKYCIPSGQCRATATKEAPLLLGRVCKEWRQFSLAVPDLWTTPQFLVRPWRDAEKERLKRSVEYWLQRSQQLPVSAAFVWNEIEGSSWDPIPLIAGFINTHSHRWQSLSFNMPTTYLSALLAAIDRSSPLLKELILKTHQPRTLRRSNTNLTHFAPQLRSITLQSLDVRDICAPWEQLTELSLKKLTQSGVSGQTCNVFFKNLNQCSNLKSLTLSLDEAFQFEDTVPSGSVILPNLENLTIEACSNAILLDDDCRGQFMDALIVPKLKAFTMTSKSPFHVGRWHHNEFLALITRSACTIESLDFTDTSISNDQLLECLQATSSLRQLLMAYSKPQPSSDIDSLFHTLTPTLSLGNSVHYKIFCPRLEMLHVRTRTFSEDAAIAMIEPRLRGCGLSGVTHLQKFWWGVPPGKNYSDLRRKVAQLEAYATGHELGSEQTSYRPPGSRLAATDLVHLRFEFSPSC